MLTVVGSRMNASGMHGEVARHAPLNTHNVGGDAACITVDTGTFQTPQIMDRNYSRESSRG